MRARRLTQPVVIALGFALVAGLLPLAAALPAPAQATVAPITIESSATVVPSGSTVTLTVRTFNTTTGDPMPVGVRLFKYPTGEFASGDTDFATGTFTVDLTLPFDATSVYASRNDTGQNSPSLTVYGTSTSTTTLQLATDPVVAGRPVTFTATATRDIGGSDMSYGTFTLHEQGSATTLAQATVDFKPAQLTIQSGLSAGTHQLVAEFPGIVPSILPSSSAPLTVVVAPDTTVEVDTPTNERTTIYPVKDGYRDTLITFGMLHEPGAVKIRVWNTGTGKVVRTLTVGSFDAPETPYSVAWSGRLADGTIAPAGTYRFEHVLTDNAVPANTTSRNTPTFKLSHKKLAWTTVATISKPGRLYGGSVTASGGYIRPGSSSYAGGLRLRNAIVNYRLTLATIRMPSNAVVKRLTFAVKGRTISGAGWLAMHNETLGPSDDPGAYDTVKRAATGYTWTRTSTSSLGAHLVGRTAYGYLEAVGTYDIDDVKLTLAYAVLK